MVNHFMPSCYLCWPYLTSEMYRVYQQFLLVLKIDIFTEFMVSLFFVIKRSTVTDDLKLSSPWIEWVQIAVTVLILPMLIGARFAVSTQGVPKVASASTILIIGILLRLMPRTTRAWLRSSLFKSLSYSTLLSCCILPLGLPINGLFGFALVSGVEHNLSLE